MKVLTAKGTGICLDHDNQMFIGRIDSERNFGVIGSYIDHRGNVQQVLARSVYGEQMIVAIALWEKETGNDKTRE